MDQGLQLLLQADQRLDTIRVSGSDVFAMNDARKLLKAVYDYLKSQPIKREENGGDVSA